MITILTAANGRELYLKRLLDSINLLSSFDEVEFEHLIVFQETAPSEKIKEYIKSLPFGDKVITAFNPSQMPIGEVVFQSAQRAKHPIFIKLDDDVVLSSADFFPRVVELCEKMQEAILYPFIIDGDTPLHDNSSSQQVVYLQKSNIYVTLTNAGWPSGKYIAPTALLKTVRLKEQNDAQQLYVMMSNRKIPIHLIKNSIIIENQEGWGGQIHRAKDKEGQKW